MATVLSSDIAVTALEALYDGVTYNTPEWDGSPVRITCRRKEPFDQHEAKEQLCPLDHGQSVNVDYFQGQCIKVLFTPSEMILSGYNKNHGKNRAQMVLAAAAATATAASAAAATATAASAAAASATAAASAATATAAI
jgi:hypothetical protein